MSNSATPLYQGAVVRNSATLATMMDTHRTVRSSRLRIAGSEIGASRTNRAGKMPAVAYCALEVTKNRVAHRNTLHPGQRIWCAPTMCKAATNISSKLTNAMASA